MNDQYIDADTIRSGIINMNYVHFEDRVMARFFAHGLSPAEHERLAMLGEEAAEIGQMVGKIMRFGYASRHPDGGPTNLELLVGEIEDLLAVITLMNRTDLDFKFENVDAPASKIERKLKYSRHQGAEVDKGFQE